MADTVQLIEPTNLVYNAGNAYTPDYKSVKYLDLVNDDTLLHTMNRIQQNVDGVFVQGRPLQSDRDYYFAGISIRTPTGDVQCIEGIIIGSEEDIRAFVAHKGIPKVTSDMLRKGYNIYFDGLLEITIVGALKQYREMKKCVEPQE